MRGNVRTSQMYRGEIYRGGYRNGYRNKSYERGRSRSRFLEGMTEVAVVDLDQS